MDWLFSLCFFEAIPGGAVASWPQFPALSHPLGAIGLPLLALLAVVGVVLAYRREPAYVSTPRKRLLTTLRSAAVLLMLFVATGAVVQLSRRDVDTGTVLVLVDRSASMSLADRRTTPDDLAAAGAVLYPGVATLSAEQQQRASTVTRAELLATALEQQGGLRQRLARFAIEPFAIGAHPGAEALTRSATGAIVLPQSDAPATQLGTALRDASARLSGRHIAGVVMLSDGGWNRGEDPVQVARDLRLPVIALGIGVAEIRDVAIPFAVCDDVVFRGDAFPLSVRVVQRGCAGRTARLTIREIPAGAASAASPGKIVAERSLTLGASEETVNVEIVPAKTGVFTYIASIEAFPDELLSDNNVRSRSQVRVIDRKVRLLLIEDAPRYEYRFLRGVLDADATRLETRQFLRQADPDLLRMAGTTYLPHFPATPAELRSYHLVVLGDAGTDMMTRADFERLAAFVREDGGALIIVAGRQAMPFTHLAQAGSVLRDLLPVELPASAPRPHTVERELTASASAEYRPRPTEAGLRSPLLNVAAFDQGLSAQGSGHAQSSARTQSSRTQSIGELFARASPLFWFAPCGAAKPGASVLLEHPSEAVPDGKGGTVPLPLMATQRYGRGQIVYLGFDESWRWRHQPGTGFHKRFWGSLATSLGMAQLLSGGNRIQLDSDRTSYQPGDEARISARVLGADFRPYVADQVTAELDRDGLDRERFDLRPVPGEPGHYAATLRLTQVGAATIRVTPPGAAVGAMGSRSDPAELNLVVEPLALETTDARLRSDTLQAIAAAGAPHGGYALLGSASAATLIDRLNARPAIIGERREERALWNAPLLILLIAALLGSEWFLRKRYDLL